MTCPECGRNVPAHLKHLPSRSTDGSTFGGDNPCLVVAIDKNGRTAREAAEWAKLEHVARRRESETRR